MCLTRTRQPKIDRARIKAAEGLDGKFVAQGNDDTLSAGDEPTMIEVRFE